MRYGSTRVFIIGTIYYLVFVGRRKMEAPKTHKSNDAEFSTIGQRNYQCWFTIKACPLGIARRRCERLSYHLTMNKDVVSNRRATVNCILKSQTKLALSGSGRAMALLIGNRRYSRLEICV